MEVLKTVPPFLLNEEVDLEGHEAWFVDKLHTLHIPCYFLSVYDEANTRGMIWGAENVPLPASKGSEWRDINGVIILICPIVLTNKNEIRERQARLNENIYSYVMDFDKMWEQFKSELLEIYKPLKEYDVKKASALELTRRLPDLRAAVFRMSEVHFYMMYVSFYLFMAFEDLCQELFGIDATHPDFQAMVTGFDNRSFQCERGVWELSQKALRLDLSKYLEFPSREVASRISEVPNGTKWLKDIYEFIEEFGWRNEHLWNPASPSWQDDPMYVIQRVKAYLKADAYPPDKKMKELAEKREKKRAEYLQKTPEDKKELFNLLLRGASSASIYSEEHDLYCEMYTDALVRRYYVELGKRFVDAGTINDVSDIFLLHLGEIQMIGYYPEKYRLQSLIAARKEKAERDLKESIQLPNVISNRMTEQEAFQWMMSAREPIFLKVVVGELPKPKPGIKADLIGVAGAAGIAEGPARVCFSMDDLKKVKPGDILVAVTTSITWTPVFSLIKGAVLDRGGTLSHAAVVCREYGIPCVLNTFQATAKIKDGQMIRVDGNEGAVYILE